jgi:hypothetical protein
MARFDHEKVEFWRGIIGRQQSSGVSAMRFCREEAIPYWKFNYWKKLLGKIDRCTDQLSESSTPGVDEFANEVDSEEQRSSFAEVCLVGERPGPGSPVVEIVFPGGVTVRLYRQIDIQLVPALIREVTGQ